MALATSSNWVRIGLSIQLVDDIVETLWSSTIFYRYQLRTNALDSAVKILLEAGLSLRYLNIASMSTEWELRVKSRKAHEPLPIVSSSVITNLKELSLHYGVWNQPLYLYDFIKGIPKIRKLDVRVTGGSQFAADGLQSPADQDMEIARKTIRRSSLLESLSFSTFSPIGACDAQVACYNQRVQWTPLVRELTRSNVPDAIMQHHFASMAPATLINTKISTLRRHHDWFADNDCQSVLKAPQAGIILPSCADWSTFRALGRVRIPWSAQYCGLRISFIGCVR